MAINRTTKNTSKDYPDNVLATIGYYEAIDVFHFVTEYHNKAKGNRAVEIAAEKCLQQMIAKGADGKNIGVVLYDFTTKVLYIGYNRLNILNGRMALHLITCIEVEREDISAVDKDGNGIWSVIASTQDNVIRLKDFEDRILMSLVEQYGLQDMIKYPETPVLLSYFDNGVSKFFAIDDEFFIWNGEEFEMNFAFLKIK